MAYVRFTLLRPRQGEEREAARVLDTLDSHIARAPGLLLSLVMTGETDGLGRVSVWRSKEEANREAMSDRTMALRSRLHQLAATTEEHLFELESGNLRKALESLLALDRPPEEPMADVYQVALPVQ